LFEIDENSRLGAEVIRHGNRYHAASVPDDDFMAEAYETACAELTKEGYAHYEISNFALPGFESQHNRKYWRLQPYIGLGAGAHSFDGAHRWANLTQHEEYRQKIAEGVSPIAEWSHLDRVGQLEEFFFLGLREREGISLRTAREHWGDREVLRWEPKISELVRDGWLEREADRLRVAPRALLVSNEIFREFLA
jgi:oxygen-independent coproporphyrinogen-3 oxidase